jgi:DNA polymerase
MLRELASIGAGDPEMSNPPGEKETPPDARSAALDLLRWQLSFGIDEALSAQPIAGRVPQPSPWEEDGVSLLAPGEGQRGADTVLGAPHPAGLTAPAARPPASDASEAVGQSARAIAEACATLEELEAAISGFTACPLRAGATTTVFADGRVDSDLMLVGEAPGREEDLAGLPFVGRSGQLLDRMLAAIGLSRKAEDPRRAVYIANILPWRPPGNRTPTTADAAMCLPFIERHIVLKRPKLLVLVGGVAAKYLLGTEEGILRLRGRWRAYEPPGGDFEIPVLPTLHPAYLLRQPAQKRLAWRDLLEVKKALDRL